jgi:fucose 4-O-acetylase-like acetyltransferase
MKVSLISLWLYVIDSQALVNVPTYSGLVFAEIYLTAGIHDFAYSDSVVPRIISPILFVFGWYMMSYPGEDETWAPWFRWVWANKDWIYGGGDTYRFSCIIGAWSVLVSILLSSAMQSCLNAPLFQWLGQHSFAIYLIHGTVLRSVFTFFAFGPFSNEQHPDPTGFRLIISLLIFLWVTLYLSSFWMKHVEPFCTQLTDSIYDMLGSSFDVSKMAESLFAIQSPDTVTSKPETHESILVNMTEFSMDGANQDRLD